MALIAMCMYDTLENKKGAYTRITILSLSKTIDLDEHRVIVVDNASTCPMAKETKSIAEGLGFEVITMPENVGTAKGINEAWKRRRENEHLIKMDNDVYFHQSGWATKMEDAIEQDPSIGIIGLKRKDLLESPDRTDIFRSELKMLPHKAGEPWIAVEVVNHVMGTCQMYNSKLIDVIGGLYQMDGLYGFDDSLAAVRCNVAGFYSCFLSNVDIDHIDAGDTAHQSWKEKYAMSKMQEYNKVKQEYLNGTRSIYIPL